MRPIRTISVKNLLGTSVHTRAAATRLMNVVPEDSSTTTEPHFWRRKLSAAALQASLERNTGMVVANRYVEIRGKCRSPYY